MTNIEKSDYFDSLQSEKYNRAEVKKLGAQSAQIVLQCGCTQTQNFLCGRL
jgi:hypothetical protein